MSGLTCEGSRDIPDALSIPANLDNTRVERLFHLGMTLRAQRLHEVEDKISEIADDADLDEDPEPFRKIANALTKLEDLKVDDQGANLIDDARIKIKGPSNNLRSARKSVAKRPRTAPIGATL